MNTPGQVIKQLKAEFLKRITPLPESSQDETATYNFIVGCFNDAAADVLISAYEPTTAAKPSEDVKLARIEKAKKTREENKRKREEKRVARERKKYQRELEQAREETPELVS